MPPPLGTAGPGPPPPPIPPPPRPPPPRLPPPLGALFMLGMLSGFGWGAKFAIGALSARASERAFG
ncbi:MAG TPA: hypothetical protein VL049_16970, partial [Candidatus Dormibacteraeota bacterium]|nr:hypothetical protein [Candidatus Dormibacteraeota bacterium]